MTKRTKAKQREMEAACTAVIRALAAQSPECEEGHVLTRSGLVSVSCRPCLVREELGLFCRFLTPGISSRRKWNHVLTLEDPAGQATRLFELLWPSDAELAEVQFLAACGQVFAARRDWTWDRYIYGPTAKNRHLRVVGQPGTYSVNLSVWVFAGESFKSQDDCAFWAIVREFGAGEAIASRREHKVPTTARRLVLDRPTRAARAHA